MMSDIERQRIKIGYSVLYLSGFFLKDVNLVTTPVASVFFVFGFISSMKLYCFPFASNVKGLPSFCKMVFIKYDFPTWLTPYAAIAGLSLQAVLIIPSFLRSSIKEKNFCS